MISVKAFSRPLAVTSKLPQRSRSTFEIVASRQLKSLRRVARWAGSSVPCRGSIVSRTPVAVVTAAHASASVACFSANVTFGTAPEPGAASMAASHRRPIHRCCMAYLSEVNRT